MSKLAHSNEGTMLAIEFRRVAQEVGLGEATTGIIDKLAWDCAVATAERNKIGRELKSRLTQEFLTGLGFGALLGGYLVMAILELAR